MLVTVREDEEGRDFTVAVVPESRYVCVSSVQVYKFDLKLVVICLEFAVFYSICSVPFDSFSKVKFRALPQSPKEDCKWQTCSLLKRPATLQVRDSH